MENSSGIMGMCNNILGRGFSSFSGSFCFMTDCHNLQVSVLDSSTQLQPDVGIILPCEVL